MARFAVMIVAAVMVISASLCVDSIPFGGMFYTMFSPDHDSYKIDRRIRSASSALPSIDNSDVIDNADLKVGADKPEFLVQSNGEESSKPTSGKLRRSAYWYPYWAEQGFWTPSPTEGSHFVYDSYLGKVRREAPNAPSHVTTPSYPQMIDSKQTH